MGKPLAESPQVGRPWPTWACRLVSALLIFHMTAIVISERAGGARVSNLEADLGAWFWGYVVLINQEYAHSYFAPEPEPSTPVVIARLSFGAGQDDQEVRIPDRATRPHINYLRQVALAWHLTHEWSHPGADSRPYWAASCAKHLCRTHPGCWRVTLLMRSHVAPDPVAVVEAAARGERLDLDSEHWFGDPQVIGAFACDEF